MRIALCSKGKELTSEVDDRFGRASYFLVYDTESSNITVIENSAKSASGGAGGLAVQQIIDAGGELVVAPEVGPQALDALNKFGIPAFKQGDAKTVAAVIAAWEKGALEKVEKPGNKGLHKA